jgi:hypothetical protein
MDHEHQEHQELQELPIPEDLYKADFLLNYHYQNISSELLRLSLAGIAAVGFFLTLISRGEAASKNKTSLSVYFKVSVLFGLLVLGVAAGCALAHRFLASDGMFYHLKAIRESRKTPSNAKEVCINRNRRNSIFHSSGICLTGSAYCLVIGSVILGFTFFLLLNNGF